MSSCKVGEKVLWPKYCGIEVREDLKYLMIKQEDIIAIYEDDDEV